MKRLSVTYPALFLLLLVAVVTSICAGAAKLGISGPGSDTRDPKQAQNFDGPAELPRVQVATAMRDTPAPGKAIHVRAGEDASQAVEKAACGDTVELQAGASFPQLVLPAKKCDDAHWIIVRTSAPDSKLPPEGTRLEPCYAGVTSLPGRPPFHCKSSENVLAKLQSEGKGPGGPVTISPGANHYRLIGLEVTRHTAPNIVYNLIGPQDAPADHLIFDRMWIHGSPQDETARGVMLSHLRYVAVIDSYLSDFHCVAISGACVDSQAVAGGSGNDPMGPFKIENNFMEGAAETILLGGSAGTETPYDIVIRRNHMFKPLIWMKGQPGFVGGLDGNAFIVKNLFELKNAVRLLFEGNVLENSWGGFSQSGFAIGMGPKNQAHGKTNVCPTCQVTDITIRYCTISHVGGGFGLGNGLSDNGGAAKDGGRYSIHDVIIDDIQAEAYGGRGTFAQISTAPGVSAAVPLHDVSIDHVTAFPSHVLFNIGGPLNEPRMSHLSITNNVLLAHDHPVTTTGGGMDRNCSAGPRSKTMDVALESCFSSYVFQNNVIVGGGSGWPKGTVTPSNLADVGFANPKEGNGGEYRLTASSKFRKKGTDGKDVGADIDAIEHATADVR